MSNKAHMESTRNKSNSNEKKNQEDFTPRKEEPILTETLWTPSRGKKRGKNNKICMTTKRKKSKKLKIARIEFVKGQRIKPIKSIQGKKRKKRRTIQKEQNKRHYLDFGRDMYKGRRQKEKQKERKEEKKMVVSEN